MGHTQQAALRRGSSDQVFSHRRPPSVYRLGRQRGGGRAKTTTVWRLTQLINSNKRTGLRKNPSSSLSPSSIFFLNFYVGQGQALQGQGQG